MKSRPIIAITMGDPRGVGPEIIIKALDPKGDGPEIYGICRPLVVGSAEVLSFVASRIGAAGLNFHSIAEVEQAEFQLGALDVIDRPNNIDLEELKQKVDEGSGTAWAAAGDASVDYIRTSACLALEGKVDAIATAPIDKKAVREAGHSPGHTELLAECVEQKTGKPVDCTTMLIAGNLRVSHVTRHVPLRDISSKLTKESILTTIEITDRDMRAMGFSRPRIAVAGLNPHLEEGGKHGREEREVIKPAIEAAAKKGIAVNAEPLPADSVFFRARRGEFDAVVAMYHDQGHIAIKATWEDFKRSITVTLGLPFTRTSVDHGTAFDIAWKGIADHSGLVEAIREAVRIV